MIITVNFNLSNWKEEAWKDQGLHCLLNFLFCKSTEPKGEENTDVAREEEKEVTITTPQKASVILRTNRDCA